MNRSLSAVGSAVHRSSEDPDNLQSRFGLALLASSTTLLQQTLRTLLHHAALPLLFNVLLFLTESQSVGNSQQQDAGGQNPQAFAGICDAGAGGRVYRVRNRRDLGPCLGRHDVLERADSVVQCLVDCAV